MCFSNNFNQFFLSLPFVRGGTEDAFAPTLCCCDSLGYILIVLYPTNFVERKHGERRWLRFTMTRYSDLPRMMIIKCELVHSNHKHLYLIYVSRHDRTCVTTHIITQSKIPETLCDCGRTRFWVSIILSTFS